MTVPDQSSIISAADLRSIPLEVLREYALTEAERSSVRALAERIGVGRTTLHNFIREGSTPHPRVRLLVGLRYIKETGGVQVRTDACEVLLALIPPEHRDKATEELTAFVRDLHRRYKFCEVNKSGP